MQHEAVCFLRVPSAEIAGSHHNSVGHQLAKEEAAPLIAMDHWMGMHVHIEQVLIRQYIMCMCASTRSGCLQLFLPAQFSCRHSCALCCRMVTALCIRDSILCYLARYDSLEDVTQWILSLTEVILSSAVVTAHQQSQATSHCQTAASVAVEARIHHDTMEDCHWTGIVR